MYKFDAIILEKNILREKHIRIVVLSRDYGKITVWSKKPINGVDIWDIAQLVVKRDNNINTLKSISSKHYIINKSWNFESIYTFLTLIKTLSFCTAESEIASHIFDDYKTTISTLDSIQIDHCLLLHMRIFHYLWSLNSAFFEKDPILYYMYQNIATAPIAKILQTKPLKDAHRNAIEKSNQFSFSTFL